MKKTFFCLLLIFLAVAILATAYFSLEPGADDSDEPDKMDTSSASVSDSEVDLAQWELIFEGTDSAPFDAWDKIAATEYRFVGETLEYGECRIRMVSVFDNVPVSLSSHEVEDDENGSIGDPFEFTDDLSLLDFSSYDPNKTYCDMKYSTLKVYRYNDGTLTDGSVSVGGDQNEIDPSEWELIFEGADSADFDAVDQVTATKYRFIGTGTGKGYYSLTIDLIGTDGEDDLVDVTWIDEYWEVDSLDPRYFPYIPFDFTVELDLSDYDEGDQVTHFTMNDQTVEYSTLKIYRYIG